MELHRACVAGGEKAGGVGRILKATWYVGNSSAERVAIICGSRKDLYEE